VNRPTTKLLWLLRQMGKGETHTRRINSTREVFTVINDRASKISPLYRKRSVSPLLRASTGEDI